MAKLQKDKLGTTKTKPAIKETTMKKSGRKTTTKKPTSKEAVIRTARIRKEYIESRNVCKVTFRLPKIAALNSKSVCIVGDFNNWNIHANPMKRQKNGDYDITLELEPGPGREYRFRYLIDESKWENDRTADKHVKSPFEDSDYSVIIV